MKIELTKETRLIGEPYYLVKITPNNGSSDFKVFNTVADAETWIDEYRYKIQEAKSELLKTYEI
jgi:hypothetical protein